MGWSALLKHGPCVGLIFMEAAFHGLAAGLSSTVGLAVAISGVLALVHGASLANRLSESWFASAFDGKSCRNDMAAAT